MDWTRPAVEIERQVRALAPTPSAFTSLAGRLLKIHRAEVDRAAAAGEPGRVVAVGPAGIVVATGSGALRLLELQLEGRRRLAAAQFLAGHPIAPGTCLGAA
jgi:methionyl-tRNA formyltransferase